MLKLKTVSKIQRPFATKDMQIDTNRLHQFIEIFIFFVYPTVNIPIGMYIS